MSESDVTAVQGAPAAYEIEVGAEPLDRPARNSMGGWPFLDDSQKWPECFCGSRMALFFQLDIPGDVEFFGGDHLLVFHCRTHNDATSPELADGRLVPRYWDAPQPHYPSPFWRVLLLPDATRPAVEAEPSLRALPLTLRPFVDAPDELGLGAATFKVGGAPSWAQEAEYYTCSCGTDLVYVCQVPEGMEVAVRSNRPGQPDNFGRESDGLFLGNENYLLACPSHCDPAAVWPVNQN
ncbi:hypothetical protein ACFVYF_17065 [Streptomyces sp. NPDC058274]|uniref:hypothetical protein n=1 Tax=Streptomyces sp. NPDC058274 TaxID=3346416 RepID=UPI0036E3A4F1